MRTDCGALDGQVRRLQEMLRRCALCPRKCGVNRAVGERGYCALDHRIVLSHTLPHHGEEPPLSGNRGAGAVFFSSCNLQCTYCQNHQISHTLRGRCVGAAELAGLMLDLESSGCHNVEAVTPTPQVPRIAEALCIARDRGLRVPFVYNCGGYENPAVLRLLRGMVDIYLPDFKYGLSEDAAEFSGAGDYPRWALESIKEMIEQVGAGLDVRDGVALKGLLVRHLVLPGRKENSLAVLRLIAKHLSTAVPVSIMSQYTPMPFLQGHPSLGRRLTKEEYADIVEEALDMGFEEIYTQEVDDRALNPDFNHEQPFRWV